MSQFRRNCDSGFETFYRSIISGALKQMDNLYYGMKVKSSKRRKRRKKGPVLLILMLLAVAIGFGVYFIVNRINEKSTEPPNLEVGD